MKHIFKVLLIGIGLGIFLAELQRILSIDSKTFMHYYWMAAPVVVIAATLIYCIYYMSYAQKIKHLEKLFRQEQFSEYVDGTRKLLQTAKGKYLKAILTLNLAAGFMEMEQLDAARQMLESISVKDLKGGAVKVVYYINLCECYIRDEQSERACEIYRERKDLFDRYRGSKIYGANIALLDIMIAICKDEREQAKSLLGIAQKTWQEARFQTTFQKLADVVNQPDISTDVQGGNADGKK